MLGRHHWTQPQLPHGEKICTATRTYPKTLVNSGWTFSAQQSPWNMLPCTHQYFPLITDWYAGRETHGTLQPVNCMTQGTMSRNRKGSFAIPRGETRRPYCSWQASCLPWHSAQCRGSAPRNGIPLSWLSVALLELEIWKATLIMFHLQVSRSPYVIFFCSLLCSVRHAVHSTQVTSTDQLLHFMVKNKRQQSEISRPCQLRGDTREKSLLWLRKVHGYAAQTFFFWIGCTSVKSNCVSYLSHFLYYSVYASSWNLGIESIVTRIFINCLFSSFVIQMICIVLFVVFVSSGILFLQPLEISI